MKKTLLLSVLFILSSLFFLASSLNAQAPSWNWANKAGGNQYDFGSSLKVDANGNTYVTGGYNSATIAFGSVSLNNFLAGSPDLFVAKYDASGNVIWAKSFGGNGFDVGSSIAIDPNGNSYITGYFTSPTIDFNGTIINHSLTFNPNIFLLKLDNQGNVLWAKGFGGNYNSDIGNDIVTLSSGGCTIVGSFSDDTLHFDGNYVVNTTIGPDQGFIASFDALGNNVWCKSIGGVDDDYLKNVSIDQSGNIYVVGSFLSEFINADTFTVANDTNDATYDIFIAKYSSSGNVQWIKSFGGNSDEFINGLATDAQGNSWVIGDYRSEHMQFDATLITRPVSNLANQFIAKINNAGAVQWVKNYSGDLGTDGSNCIAIDGSGNSYYDGLLQSNTISFGSLSLNRTDIDGDEFILKLDGSGNEKWVKSYVTKGTTKSIVADVAGNTFITGNYQNSSAVFGNSTLANSGVADMFIARLNATMGVDDIDVSSSVLFPNPASSNAVLHTKFNLKNASFIIYNLMGEIVVQQDNVVGDNININTEKITNGLYFLRVVQDGETLASHKLTVTK